MIELGLEALYFLEQIDELRPCGIAFQVGHFFRRIAHALRLHEVGQLLGGGLQVIDDLGRRVYQPDFTRVVDLLAREQCNRLFDRPLLLTEVEDVAIGLAVVQHAIGARKRLDQAVMLEVLIHV